MTAFVKNVGFHTFTTSTVDTNEDKFSMMPESYPKAGIDLYQDRIGDVLSVLTRVACVPLNGANIIGTYAVINPSTCFQSKEVLMSEFKNVRLVLQSRSLKLSSPRHNSTQTAKKKVTYNESKRRK